MNASDLVASVTTILATATATASTGGREIDMLSDLAVIMCVAAVTTVLFQRIKQPVVLGYLLAGVIVGPHLPIPLFASDQLAHKMSELGMVLLMFSLGLEFSLRSLAKVGPTAGLVAIIETSLMMSLGYLVAGRFGWTGFERLFVGAMVAISSTTVIAKAFAEQTARLGKDKKDRSEKTEKAFSKKLSEVVFGILIVEDLAAIILLAVLTPIASGVGLSAGDLALVVGRLAGFLAILLVLGILVVPRLVRMIVRINRPETTVVACVGICFGFALLARNFGYSVALGAFLGGALVAESGLTKKVEPLVEPVRDVFAAVFFVSVGMLIDPVIIAEHWMAVLCLTLVVVGGKVFGVTLGAFLAGNSVRTSVRAGMSLAQIGEFSFIIAGVGLSLGVVRSFLYPVAVAVSALTTLITPFLIRASGPVASYVDRRLPHPVQTFTTLYASWISELRASPAQPSAWARLRRLAGLLFLDIGIIAFIVIGASINMDALLGRARSWLVAGDKVVRDEILRVLYVGGAVLLILPFVFGAVRLARALGTGIAGLALPRQAQGGAGDLDLAATPRRVLLVTLQLAILLVAGIPLVAVTQPFVTSMPGLALLFLGVLALAVPFWRSTTSLDGHVRAGAQVLLEALARQSYSDRVTAEMEVRRLVPGLGEATTLKLPRQAPSVGRTLKQLDLRGLTGASVIAIERGSSEIMQVIHPSAEETLLEGDCLVLAGTDEAIVAARGVLAGATRSEPSG
jgi:CPA2 family monovalent cation:H+ antiporter-2